MYSKRGTICLLFIYALTASAVLIHNRQEPDNFEAYPIKCKNDSIEFAWATEGPDSWMEKCPAMFTCNTEGEAFDNSGVWDGGEAILRCKTSGFCTCS
ncbi:hypothetical protein B0H14DRAFT_1316000 [Mycena olivaceomarginata]|nr:hypothetical protein B0H14DRAFT_1316000 [Mycena olivaceomarginata]